MRDGTPPFETVQAAFDEGFKLGTMTGKAEARPEQEALDRSYTTGFQLGYMKALSNGGQYNCRIRATDLRAPSTPDPAAWISGVS